MTISPWNKSRMIGEKRPFQISHIWAIRIRLELEGKIRDLALFNMALGSKLRGGDLLNKCRASPCASCTPLFSSQTERIRLRSSEFPQPGRNA